MHPVCDRRAGFLLDGRAGRENPVSLIGKKVAPFTTGVVIVTKANVDQPEAKNVVLSFISSAYRPIVRRCFNSLSSVPVFVVSWRQRPGQGERQAWRGVSAALTMALLARCLHQPGTPAACDAQARQHGGRLRSASPTAVWTDRAFRPICAPVGPLRRRQCCRRP